MQNAHDEPLFSILDLPDGSNYWSMPSSERNKQASDEREWPEADGITALGTPLGSPGFVQTFL